QHRRDAGATLTDFQLSGKHISPRDLRESADFDRLLLVVSRKRKDLKEKAHLRLTTEHLKGEAVAHRLALFDALCGKKVHHLARKVVVSGEFVDLQSFGVIESNVRMAPEEFLAKRQKTVPRFMDPIRMVPLDRNHDGDWFSLSEVRAFDRYPRIWERLIA